MAWGVFSRVGSMDGLDLGDAIELLDLPEDYPTDELHFYGPLILDKNGECVAVVALEA